jgi:uncharacterized integral membrane protein
MAFISTQYQNYNDLRLIGGSMMLSGFVMAVALTVIAGVITDGFQPDPLFYKFWCPIVYGITGSVFIGGLITVAVANCKMHALTAIENPINHDAL